MSCAIRLLNIYPTTTPSKTKPFDCSTIRGHGAAAIMIICALLILLLHYQTNSIGSHPVAESTPSERDVKVEFGTPDFVTEGALLNGISD